MRVLVIGATGLIGSAVIARFHEAGHEVVAVARHLSDVARRLAASHYVSLDIAKATQPENWIPHLSGVNAVVNCAGVLQDSTRDSTAGVHVHGMSALFAACERVGVRRVIHLSAIGVDREAPTAFSRSKLQGDEDLMARDLDWVILRPSVVVGRPAYGGSALFRGLAALPILPVAPDTGPLQVVQLNDLTRTMAWFLRPDAPARLVLEVAGPERLSMSEIAQKYRRWLGKRPARVVTLPSWAARAMYIAADFAGWLGWRPPMRSTGQREIVRGAVGDPSEWTRLTGILPQSLDAALAAEPASVQERWFASLYFLKALGLVVFAAFWIATGVVSLTIGWEIGKNLMFEGGVPDPYASLTVIAGALADIVIGALIAFRRTSRWGLWAALAISFTYAIIGTILVPGLWSNPLGPLLKIWPVIVFNMMLLAINEDR
jgi:uncharacterized protein YbjT (DUF2867 family)